VNLIVELPGTEVDEPWLEVGAHWDSVADSPGADDNASGVAGLLEVARVLASQGRPRRGVRLCLFGGEEGQRGHFGFEGSIAHVSALDSPVSGAIVLEMIGYRSPEPGSQRVPEQLVGLMDVPDAGDFIAVVGDERSADYVARIEMAARRHVPDLAVFAVVLPEVALPLVSRSDHVPYWHAGLKGVLVTDTSEYRTPHYHHPGDVLATLDLDFAAQVTTMVTVAAMELTGPWGPG
jgi:Zn-dependent M28 family amino/carboxypeptidase